LRILEIWGGRKAQNPADYYDQYLGFSLRFVKRLSNRWMLNGSFTLQDYSSPNPYETGETMYTQIFGMERLPLFWNVNARLEKVLKIGDTERIYLMLDAFNKPTRIF
jgi:hypothetical protein